MSLTGFGHLPFGHHPFGHGLFAAQYFFATADVKTLAKPYYARLLKPPEVEAKLTDTGWGVLEMQRVTATLADGDGALVAPFKRGFRGQMWQVSTHDASGTTQVPIWTGIVESCSRNPDGSIEFEGLNLNAALFDVEIPKAGFIAKATYPKAVDFGPDAGVIPVVLGTQKLVPLKYINDDDAGSHFDYIAAWLPVTIAQLYRVTIGGGTDRTPSYEPIPPANYTVSDTLYPGWLCVRFTTRQVNADNALVTLVADLIGDPNLSSFPLAVRELLSNASWGLGATVNVASFEAAADLVAAQTDLQLRCDGIMSELKPAKEWLRDLLMPWALQLRLNSAGQWEMPLPTTRPTTIARRLRAGPDAGLRNLIDAGTFEHPAASDVCRLYTLDYHWDPSAKAFRYRQQRDFDSILPTGIGRQWAEHNRFLASHEAADRATDMLGKRTLLRSMETISRAAALLEAGPFSLGEVLSYTFEQFGLVEDLYEVAELVRQLDRYVLGLLPYNLMVAEYTRGAVPISLVAEPPPIVVPPPATSNIVQSLTVTPDGTNVELGSIYEVASVTLTGVVAGHTLSISGSWIGRALPYGTYSPNICIMLSLDSGSGPVYIDGPCSIASARISRYPMSQTYTTTATGGTHVAKLYTNTPGGSGRAAVEDIRLTMTETS